MNDIENKFIEKLYVDMSRQLWWYAFKMLNDKELADEAVQSTFMDACAKVETVIALKNPHGWLMAAMKLTIQNISAQLVKDDMLLARVKNKVRSENKESYSDEVNPDILYDDIKDSDDYIFLRCFIDSGLTVKDFAKRQGLSLEVCKKRLQRARARLQKFFE